MTKGNRKIAIWMYTNDNGSIPRRAIIDNLLALGHEVYSDFDMRRCFVSNGTVYSEDGTNLSSFDVLFHMNADESSKHQNDILDTLEASGVYIINELEGYHNARDKYRANMIMRRHGINVPRAALYGPLHDLRNIEKDLRDWEGIVYKDRFGHGASGVIRFRTPEEFIDFYQATKHLIESYYIEEYIDFGDIDLRVEIFNGHVIGGYSRRRTHTFKTNISSGGKMMARELGDEVETALAAAQAVGINGTIVDMVRSGNDGLIYVLEVNALLGIFVESAMKANTKMPVTEPDKGYSYDSLKIKMIVDHIHNMAQHSRTKA